MKAFKTASLFVVSVGVCLAPCRRIAGIDRQDSMDRVNLPPLDLLSERLVSSLRKSPLFPGLKGYCGWNYECSTMVYALVLDQDLDIHAFGDMQAIVDSFLDEAMSFPFPGRFIRLAFWLYAPGDRIGMFGSLYGSKKGDRAQRISRVVLKKLKHWKRSHGCYIRRIGWGPLWGFSLRSKWIWADDSFLGGFPLARTGDPVLYGHMILSYHQVLCDQTDNLYWHGAKVGLWTGDLEYNGIKWGRSHGWMLLAITSFLLETRNRTDLDNIRGQVSSILTMQLSNLVSYQRPTGAFGNVINDKMSPDESSLTSVFVFSVGVSFFLQSDALSGTVMDSAERAWHWLGNRTVEELAVSETCGSQHLGTDLDFYNSNVGMSSGPGSALTMYANLGANLLSLTV